MSDDKIVVGTIGGAFGVKGDVRLKSFCGEPADIADYVPLTSQDGRTFHEIVITGQTKGALIARVGGIATKEDADALKGVELLADRTLLPDLPDDEYYHADLIGLAVHDTGGELLGHVRAVQNHGAADLLELHVPGARSTVLLPFTRAVVPTVDLSKQRIVADPPEGLFD